MCFAITWPVSGNLHVDRAFGCELVITVHLCEIFMCVCSAVLVQMAQFFLIFLGPVYSTILLDPFFFVCLFRMLLTNLRNSLLRHANVNQMLVLMLLELVKGMVYRNSYLFFFFSITPSIYLEKSKNL